MGYVEVVLGLIDHPTLLGISATIGAIIIAWLVSRNKMIQAESSSSRRDGMQERATAFTEVMAVIKSLREDISDLRTELEQERVLRRAAERTVDKLLQEVALLRQLLQRADIHPPATLLLTEAYIVPSNIAE
jgi:hypothetical protein